MGTQRKINKEYKKTHAELSNNAEEFKNAIIELGKKYKMKFIPAFRKGELEIDVVCFGNFGERFWNRFKKEEFRKEASALGRSYGMAIVPIFGKYSLEVEIQVLLNRNPNKEQKNEK